MNDPVEFKVISDSKIIADIKLVVSDEETQLISNIERGDKYSATMMVWMLDLLVEHITKKFDI